MNTFMLIVVLCAPGGWSHCSNGLQVIKVPELTEVSCNDAKYQYLNDKKLLSLIRSVQCVNTSKKE